jgi:1-acyl-sn-glycerol-3-phosphate acyltransferase
MRTIFIWSYFSLILIISPLFLPFYWLSRIFSYRFADDYSHFLLRAVSRHMLNLMGASVEVRGFENIPQNHRLVFVSNHQGIADTLILTSTVPYSMGAIGMKGMLFIPFLNLWLHPFRAILVNRRSLKQSHRAIERGIGYIRQGYPVYLSPEGKLSWSGKLNRFKPGSLRLAKKSEALLQPITINGSHLLVRKDKSIHPSSITVVFHEPLDTREFETTQELALTAEKVIASGLLES